MHFIKKRSRKNLWFRTVAILLAIVIAMPVTALAAAPVFTSDDNSGVSGHEYKYNAEYYINNNCCEECGYADYQNFALQEMQLPLEAFAATTATEWDALFEAEWRAMGFTAPPAVMPGPGVPYGPLSGTWNENNSGIADHPFALITNNADRPDEDAFVIILFGDGFTDSAYDQAKWRYYSQFFARNFFRISPFYEFQDVIKIYRIDAISNDTGATRSDSPDGRNMPGIDPKDTYFGGFLWNQNMARLGGAARAARATNMARYYIPNNLNASRVILLNTDVYGGSGGATSFATLSWAFIDLVVHELAHTAGLHRDEYLTGAAGMLNYNRNNPFHSTNLVHRDHIDNPIWQEWSPWYRMLGRNGVTLDPILEGVTTNPDFENLFRPITNCKMRYLGFSDLFNLTGEEEFAFCDPCKEQWRDRISILSNSPFLHFQPYNDQFFDNEPVLLDNRHFIIRLPQAATNPDFGLAANAVNPRVSLKVFGEQISPSNLVHGVEGIITMTVFETNNGVKGNAVPGLINVPVTTPMNLPAGTYAVEATFVGSRNGAPLTLNLSGLENTFVVRPQIVVTAVGNYATPWLSTTGTGPRFRLDTLNRGWIANTPVTLPPLTIDPTRVGATNVSEFDITYTWHVRNFDGTPGTVIASGTYTPGGIHTPGPSAVGQYVLAVRTVANATYTGTVPNFDVTTEYPFNISVPFSPAPHFPINAGVFSHEAMANDFRAITIVGEGFTEEEQDQFEALAAEFITQFLDTDPVKRVASRFTFFKVNGMSMDSGISREGLSPLNTYYGFQINNDGTIGTHRTDRPMDAILLQEVWRRDTNQLTWAQWGTTVVLINADDVQANLHWRHPEYNRGVHLATIQDRNFTRLIESVVTQFAHVRSDRNPYLLDEYRWMEGEGLSPNRTFQETFERLVESSYSHEMWGVAGRPRPVIVSDAATRVYLTNGTTVVNWDLPDTFGAYAFGHRLITNTNPTDTFTIRYFADNNHRVGELLDGPPTTPGFFWAEADLPAGPKYFYGIHLNGTDTDRFGFTYARYVGLPGRNGIEPPIGSARVRGFVRFEIQAIPPAENVTITGATTVQRGSSITLTATVAPAETYQRVVWSVTGHTGVTINADGVLTVPATVPGNTVLTVAATAVGTTVVGTHTVTVTAPPADPPPPPPGDGAVTPPTQQQPEQQPDPEVPLAPPGFVDVPTHWAREAIEFVYDRGIMLGVSDTMFAPDAVLTRAMMATILWRLEGEPATVFESVFSDVPAGQWYSEAIVWASEQDIVRGIGGGLFDPHSNITREQFAAMMHRYAVFIGVDTEVPATHSLAQFTDRAQIGAWALEYVMWANYNGLLTGVTATTLQPRGNVTRAQCATVLHRFIVRFVEE